MSSSDESATVPGPATLRKPHRFVEATRLYYSDVPADEDGRMRPGPHEGIAHLIVSKATLRRALLYLQAIFVEAERRGWQVAASRGYESTGVAVVVRAHTYPVAMHELHDREPMTDEDIAGWRKRKQWELRWKPDLQPPTLKSVPNGYLKLSSLSWHGDRSSWSEGPRGPLERKLPQFFAELERRADEDDRRDDEHRREAEMRRRLELDEIERRRLAKFEQQRANALVSEVTSWRLATDVREYVAALRGRVAEGSGLEEETRRRVLEGCDWAEQWSTTSDPLANAARVTGPEVPTEDPPTDSIESALRSRILGAS